MDSLAISEAPVDDIFRILIATDTHLGYAEDDPERCNDSFIAFEEVLRLARAHEVDFLLLGGDLFHETRPSTQCMHKCLELLRQYCLGDKPISVEFLSDQKLNFQHASQTIVNYYDPNLSISIPVFSIHGNHDDPTGQKQLSCLDILSVTGFVNYFGKWTDLTEVKISPILLRKGNSKIALYGLSHIKDERLSRLFRDGKVQWFRPDEDTEDWFNIFVCHQNREERGLAKYLAEESLPAFLDLVVWGHEHECRLEDERRLELKWNPTREFYIMQPGSSVATSLCIGESQMKHVALLNVCKRKFKVDTLRLKTVRPFICETVSLSECNLPELGDNTSAKVQDYLEERINFWIDEAKKQLTGHDKQPTLPLIRVRVEYKDEEQTFNTIRFGQRFHSRVANPTDLVLLKREKKASSRKTKDNDRDEREELDELLENESGEDWESKMNYYMLRYFDEVSRKTLQVLSLTGMNDAVTSFVEKNDKEKFKMILDHQMNKVCKYLCDKKIDVDRIDEEIENYRIQRMHAGDQQEREELQRLKSTRERTQKIEEPTTIEDEDTDIENGDGDITIIQPVQSTQRGRGRGSRARGTTTTTRATTSRARGRARGTRAGAVSANTTRANTSAASSRQSSRTSQKTLTQTRLIYDEDDEDDF
ncbi:hypothetical protein V9T40_010044 [Parthenolecanium corni]|uniref:Double-strand break repair protein n=1 Tax=Parthenolecanium corni TaxID=536013 RepID=A0AAN9TYZ5_9HEMI